MPMLPTYYISHGGGPWPWVPQMRATFAKLEDSLRRLAAEQAQTPRAVLMVSGHWETPDFAVMGAARPPMVYDYANFPEHTYRVTYPSPGAPPELAERTRALIEAAGLPSAIDPDRGYDHGVFVPMAVMYPEAEVPLYQVSLQHGYDPEAHFRLGRALAPLRGEGVLIVGSGLSYHNLANFGPGAREPSAGFDAWLGETLKAPPGERTARLLDWDSAPYARAAHAEEDHLVPLFAALGAAEDAASTRIYHEADLRGGVTASSWRFG